MPSARDLLITPSPFPPYDNAVEDGLLAVGGDLSPQMLVTAYSLGIFPWFRQCDDYYWFFPDDRMVVYPNSYRCSKSLKRVLRSGKFEVRVDTSFRQVMQCCASTARSHEGSTWITPDYIDAYTDLHQLGLAHSFETFLNGELVGGLYGVSLGRVFFGESMFHTCANASKVAFAKLVDFSLRHGFDFIDTQMASPHMHDWGGTPVNSAAFAKLIQPLNVDETLQCHWSAHTVTLLLGSNQGSRYQLIRQALDMISNEVGFVSQASDCYETEPWGFDSPNKFLNIAVNVETSLSPHEVLTQALDIERSLGRQPHVVQTLQDGSRQYADRPIDIDIIFYDNIVVNTPDLQIPHPRLHLRQFVLEPLCDIMPQYIHPVLHQSVANLLHQLQ